MLNSKRNRYICVHGMRGSMQTIFPGGGVWRIFEFSRGDPPPPSIPPPFPNKHPRKHSHEYLFFGGGGGIPEIFYPFDQVQNYLMPKLVLPQKRTKNDVNMDWGKYGLLSPNVQTKAYIILFTVCNNVLVALSHILFFIR